MTSLSASLRVSVLLALTLLPFLAGGQAEPASAGAIYTVTHTNDPAPGACTASDCSLREAVIAANGAPGDDTINLPTGTYTLSIAGTGENASATGDLDITDDLTINGAGAASTIIDGGALDRVIQLAPPGVGISVEITSATIRNGNTSGGGGGIVSQHSGNTLTLTDSVVTGNAAAWAAGIVNIGGTATLTRVTISDNATAAGGLGGGMHNNGVANLTNVTISGNSATGGGGIFNEETATLANVTITGNSASNIGGGLYNFDTATLTNTIVANSPSGDDCAGTAPTSNGHNLDSDGSCGLSGTGDLSNTDPKLGPLASNGGPTQTHALLAGSPVIDSGDNVTCPATDQRGVVRPVDGDNDGIATCDRGAYEAQDSDTDGVPDAVDNCPAWPNTDQSLPPWPVPADDPDCDGFSTDNEGFVGTDPLAACGPSAWPPDFDDNQVINILDVSDVLPPCFGSVCGGPNYSERRDLDPNCVINILDVNKVLPPYFGFVCT